MGPLLLTHLTPKYSPSTKYSSLWHRHVAQLIVAEGTSIGAHRAARTSVLKCLMLANLPLVVELAVLLTP